MKKYYVADRETGTLIEEVKSIKEGKKLIAEFEEADKEENIYQPNFYDVVDFNRCSVLFN